MPNEPDLQEVLRQNLRVLLAMRRMTHGELATLLGSDRSTIAKRMNGHREWALQDLVRLADIFGVAAQELIGNTSHLVAVIPPAATGTDPRSRTITQYFGGEYGTVVPFPLVSAS